MAVWHANSLGMEALPLHDSAPRRLVDLVVNGDHGAHIPLLRLPPFALHCIVEHLRRRVLPHAFICGLVCISRTLANRALMWRQGA